MFVTAGAAIGASIASGLVAAGTAGLTAGAIAGTGAAIGGGLAGAATGAALGAGTAAITGGDVGKGALYGGVGGAITGGIGGALAGPGAGAASAVEGTAGTSSGIAGAVPEVGKTAAQQLAQQSASAIPSGVNVPLSSANEITSIASNTGNTAAQTIAAQQASPLIAGAVMPAAGAASEVAPSMFSQGLSSVGTWAAEHPAQAIQGVAAAGQGINALTQQYPTYLPNTGKNLPPSNIHLASDYKPSTSTSMKPLASYADGGDVSGIGTVGQSGMFPQSQMNASQYATPAQMPAQALQLQRDVNSDYDTKTNTYTGAETGFANGGEVTPPVNKYYADALAQLQTQQQAAPQQVMPAPVQQQPAQLPPTSAAPVAPSGIAGVQKFARGRLISGSGDGVSDSIISSIDGQQPARLASNEYVVPARAVSELGNGSSEAGAKRLDKMVERIQTSRKKTVGKGKIAVDARARRSMPA